MIKAVGNKLLMVLYFILGTCVLEFVTFRVLNLNFMPEYFLLDFSIVLFIALLIYCIPNFTIQYFVYTAIIIVQAVFLYINYSLNTIYGDLFSFDMFKLLGEANRAMTADFIYFKIIFQLVLVVMAIALIGLIFLNICKKTKIRIRQHYSIFSVIILLGVQFFACGYYVHMRSYINEMGNVSEENYINSDAFLMNTNFLKTTSYNKFGTYGYFVNLMFNSIGKTNEAQKVATIKYFNKGYNNMYNAVDQNGDAREFFGVDKGNNVIIVMMESLEWFGFGDGSYDATLENLHALNYNQTLTPNMYEILFGQDYASGNAEGNLEGADALVMKNFFAKSKTNISEGFGIIGSYPVAESLTTFAGNNYDNSLNAFGYTLPNVLNGVKQSDGSVVDYNTSYVHSNVIDFYKRSETHKNLGFDNVIGKDGIVDEKDNPIYTGEQLKWDNWAPEGDFARYAINNIVPKNYTEQPFFSFYLNVSSHGSYLPEDNKNDGDVIRYLDYVKYGKQNCQLVKANYKNDEDKFFLDASGNVITFVEDLYAYYANEQGSVPNYAWERIDKTESNKSADQSLYSPWFYNVLQNYGQYDIEKGIYEENANTELLAYYECGVVGLDEALGVIIQQLKDYNIYDNTTLVLYSDHYAYYNGVSNIIKGFDLSDTTSVELNTIPFIISSPGLKQTMLKNNYQLSNIMLNKFCSAYDVIPTTLDLLGVEFNPNFYMGHSIFSLSDYAYVIDEQTHLARDVKWGEEDELATQMVVYYSNTGGLFCKDAYTFNLKDFYNRTGAPLNDEYLIKYFKSEASNILYKLNYLQILNDNHLYNQLSKA